MGLGWFLASFFLFATSSFAEEGLDHSALHMTLHHVRGHGSPLTSQSPPSISELLSRDQARVKHLNFRLTNKSEHLFGPKSISTPVNPGESISSGNYYVEIGLGTPPSDYPVLVDTGSTISWLQCKPCEVSCHDQVVPFFDPSTSSTYKTLLCTTPECNSLDNRACTTSDECLYKVTYGDKSFTSGYLSQDSLTLTQSETLPSFVFGCGQDNEGLFGKSAGLFGLDRNKLSMFSQLSSKYGNAFSYCLPTAHGGTGGSLSIGRDSLMGFSYEFTPMLTDSQGGGFYFLSLSAIAVAGRTLGVGEAEYQVPTIIDSGTVITRLPTSVYAALRDEFTKIMSSKHETAPPSALFDTCYTGSLKEMSDVPQVRMAFQGEADLTLPPQNILYDVAEEGITCLAFAGNSDLGDIAIIGNHQHQTYSVAYDVANSRIGFAPGGCN
ncbi:aspartyl protease family protein At5g10770-like isoform X2 [Cornus florida]|uniref:aspartyl protease family protein At5g10770-like isoform X2 n=1 Tax=Cornus florida TaxID=4283 RepID=UPI00289A2031|nr:aspartyl protease family protein At5g10770-like isoform X2 [Cornus florida]